MGELGSIPISFKIYRKDPSGKPIFLREASYEQDVIKVGKGPAADLRLDDETVGLMHAFIQTTPEGDIFVSDVVSQRGTIVNGQKVNKCKLNSGDEILLGDTLLTINFAEAQAAADPVAAGPAGGAELPSFASTASMQGISTMDVTALEDTSKKQAVFVTSYFENLPVQTNVLTDIKEGEKTGVLPLVAIVFGALLVLGGMFMGYKSLAIVQEEQRVNDVIRDIAKDRGLSDKFVPKVKGDFGYELAFILLSLFGASILYAGLGRVYLRRRILANFTVGEDPSSVFTCTSKQLPSPKFPLVRTDRSAGYHLMFTETMEGSIIDPAGNKYMLTELVQQGRATNADMPGTYDFQIPDNHSARIKYNNYEWLIRSVNQSKLVLPFKFQKGLFMFLVLVSVGMSTLLAWYFVHLQNDPIFSDDTEAQETTVKAIVKPPDQVAEKKKQLEEQKQKDKEKDKQIYKPENQIKDQASAPRDARSTAQSPGQGGAGAGVSRVSGPQGIGVANVLASQISAMTASLTASNTVFGQETEDLSDLLGDGDPDGEAVDGGFGGRGGSGGGGAGGGLGIGGGGGSGWGGIGIGGGGGLGGKLGPIGGGGRRGVSMREGAAQVSGKLDPNEVRAVIRAHRNEVHHCYQKGLLQNDKLAGNVRVVFLINPAGRAQECRVEENLAVAEVGNCICGRLTTWRFPQPEGGLAKISYSWTLQPGG
ncbi:AgmX/PglI C-terminal domain-containing protein [Myxococcota bacterium]|nr:AgmX/PglI C-terminal domain-containing protein [Myxococcota bacterium]MBU1411660.1 AgmX/PglI C-terminal domain-containing protein [Myxococcota bacterium]